MVEHLLCKGKALSSNPIPQKKGGVGKEGRKQEPGAGDVAQWHSNRPVCTRPWDPNPASGRKGLKKVGQGG
jgi:hypothetical protein